MIHWRFHYMKDLEERYDATIGNGEPRKGFRSRFTNLNGVISPLRVYAAFDDVFRWDKNQPAVARDLLMVGAILTNGSTGNFVDLASCARHRVSLQEHCLK